MKVEIISIGDELLIGQTINTNASWLGQEISKIGGAIKKVITISDKKQEIIDALNGLDCDLCIITGGLGPTNDDITKHVLTDYFDSVLIMHEQTLKHIETFFKNRNRPMLQVNINQAMLPKDAEILTNSMGTAAGMWFTKDGKSVISLPGVPYEMKSIFTDEILPKLKERFSLNSLFHRTVLTLGIGESFLAQKIESWEDKISELGFSLAYLPSPGMVKLRVSSPNGILDSPQIDSLIAEVKNLIPDFIFGEEEDTISGVTGALLRSKNLTFGTVESCTAGRIASDMIANSGASNYFRGGFLTYQTAAKINVLGLQSDLFKAHDVVSESVAVAMAEAGKKLMGVDVCVSTTGVMGPTTGESSQAVGTVWIGLASNEGSHAECFNFGENRGRNIQMATIHAINLVRKQLLKKNKKEA